MFKRWYRNEEKINNLLKRIVFSYLGICMVLSNV